MVEHRLNDGEGIVADHRLVEGGPSPAGLAVGIGPKLQRQPDSLDIMPVALAQQHRGQTLGGEASRVEQNPQHGKVVRLGDVVGGFFVIRVGSVFQQQPGQAGVLRDPRRSIHHRFENDPALGEGFVPAGVGGRPGQQQLPCRFNETLGSARVEPEIT